VTARDHRLPGLDGLRALAVLMVVFHHLCSQGALGRWPALQVMLQQGSFGVQIFFVLSGFLITWLLLKEESRSGTIDIARFYFRRSLRILPPAFFYLAVILFLTVAGVLAVGTRDLLYSALFIRNAYGVGGSPEVSHYWSLAVEEQFYLTWPFLLLVLRGRTRLLVTAALIVLLAVWRSWTSLHFGVTAAGAHALLFGCLLAQLRQTPSTSPYVLQGVLQSPGTFAASGAVILAVIFFRVPDGATAGLAGPRDHPDRQLLHRRPSGPHQPRPESRPCRMDRTAVVQPLPVAGAVLLEPRVESVRSEQVAAARRPLVRLRQPQLLPRRTPGTLRSRETRTPLASCLPAPPVSPPLLKSRI